MQNNFQHKELEGMNIYLDKKGQKVYLDPITKNGFVIPEAKQRQFKTYSNVGLYAGLSAIFAYVLFELNIIICIVIGLVVFGILEWRFRLFLNNCTMYAKFKPEKKHQPTAYSSPNSIIYIKIVLYFVLSALLIATCFIGETKNASVYVATVCIAIAGIYIAIRYILILVARKKHQND